MREEEEAVSQEGQHGLVVRSHKEESHSGRMEGKRNLPSRVRKETFRLRMLKF